MDTSDILTEAVTTDGGFHFGDENAPVKVVEFINLRCPYCKEWWDKASPLLDQYVKENKVERIVKHYDKEKTSLRKGNILHAYLDYTDFDKAREDIDYYYEHQDEWGALEEDEIAAYAKDKRGANKQDNGIEAKGIIEETEKANVTLVPTVFIEEKVFDQNISEEELKEIIEAKL